MAVAGHIGTDGDVNDRAAVAGRVVDEAASHLGVGSVHFELTMAKKKNKHVSMESQLESCGIGMPRHNDDHSFGAVGSNVHVWSGGVDT